MTAADVSTREIDTLLKLCRAKAETFTLREIEFLCSIANLGDRQPSVAQIEWLRDLAAREKVDFEAVNRAAMPHLHAILKRWLPDGAARGKEFVALNPMRGDTTPGSFSISLATGRWADFADDSARGSDPVSLAAYLFHNGDQIAAALALKGMVAA